MEKINLWDKFISLENFKIAWEKVLSNAGSAGIDNFSIKDFQINIDENISILRQMIIDEEYEPLPLLKIGIEKSDKEKRYISIPTIRDRIVQTALYNVLQPIFEYTFLECNYGYRPQKSAHHAIKKVEEYIKEGNFWVLKSDIKSFFDEIDLEILIDFLKNKIENDKILNLITKILYSGEYRKGKGLPQGAVTSPLFSNIYINEFDKAISKKYKLIRYVDDFVVLDKDKEILEKALNEVVKELEKLKLEINIEKTKISHITEKFVFLGYEFDELGKRPSPKALQNFVEKVYKETHPIPRREKIRQIINGWKGYFELDGLTLAEIEDKLENLEKGNLKSDPLKIVILATLIELGKKKDAREKLYTYDFYTSDPRIYKEVGLIAMELGEEKIAYENFLKSYRYNPQDYETLYYLGLLNINREEIETAVKFLQDALEINPDFSKAHYTLGLAYKKLKLNSLSDSILKDNNITLDFQDTLEREEDILLEKRNISTNNISSVDLKIILQNFSGREGIYAKQIVNDKGKVIYIPIKEPLKEETLLSHLKGEITVGIYLTRFDNTVNFTVIDIDLKKGFFEKEINQIMIENALKKGYRLAFKIKEYGEKYNIPIYIEDSGYKGMHCWIFFSQPIKAKIARELSKFLIREIGEIPQELSIEIFPKQDMIASEALGSLIKLPLGIHRKTGKYSFFIDNNGNPVRDQISFVVNFKKISLKEIDDILREGKLKVEEKINEDLRILIEKCNVIRYLIEKAKDRHELNHTERLVLLYTLGHLGDYGKNYIHYLMSQCPNYSYKYTQKWIDRLEKNKNPISCAKIRDWLSYITPSIGCYCNFDLRGRDYPNPLLHMRSKRGENSFEININKEVNKEMNSQKDINSLLKEYIELKKERKRIEDSIKRCERDMIEIFQKENLEVVETDIGLLRMLEREGKIYWVIEL